MGASLTGRLLVASPELGDPNFERTVVYLLEHDAGGALGVVINRPTGAAVVEHFAGLGALATDPAEFFAGGPVSEGSVVVLGRVEGGPVELVDLSPVLEGAVAPSHLRVFVGYAGWAPGQLDGEVATGSWFVCDASPDDVFAPSPADLWRAVLRRQPPPLARLARYPDDVTLN